VASEPPPVLNQLLRYDPVVRLLEPVGGGRLLDVGSGSYGVARWLSPRWDVTAVDVSFDDYGGASGPVRRAVRPVLGSVTSLPFRDRAFDAVLSLDVHEHLPVEVREQALAELVRVTRRRLIVACPTGAAARDADRRLYEFYRQRDGHVIRWLAEHVEFEMPERDPIVTALRPHGRVGFLRHENARRHLRLMRWEATLRGQRAQALAARALAGAVREGRGRGSVLLRLIGGNPRRAEYRSIVVLEREGQPLTRSSRAPGRSPRRRRG
jgi:SAM-dependent methyltransferase